MPGSNKVEIAGIRQLTYQSVYSSQFLWDSLSKWWQEQDNLRDSRPTQNLHNFSSKFPLLISEISMLLKRRVSHNFPCLSIVGKATTELELLGNLTGSAALSHENSGPTLIHQPWLGWWWEGGRGVPADPDSSQMQIIYNHRALFLRLRA